MPTYRIYCETYITALDMDSAYDVGVSKIHNKDYEIEEVE